MSTKAKKQPITAVTRIGPIEARFDSMTQNQGGSRVLFLDGTEVRVIRSPYSTLQELQQAERHHTTCALELSTHRVQQIDPTTVLAVSA